MVSGREARAIRGRGRTAMLAAALILPALSPVLAQEGASGVMRFYWNEQTALDLEQEGYGSTLDFRFRRSVTTTFSYLFTLRASGSREESLFLGPDLVTIGSGRQRTNQWEPRLEFRWSPGKIDLTLGDRYQETADRNPLSEAAGAPARTERRENNFYARLNSRFDVLPQVLVEYERRDVDVPDGRETSSDRLFGQVSYSGDLGAVSAGRRRTTETIEDSIERTVDENLLAASVQRQFAGGEVSVFAGYSLNELEAREEFPTELLVPVFRPVRRGLSALDTSPEDGALPADQDLTDGRRGQPTQANIGGSLAGGQVAWNLGAELTFRDPVDTADVWLSEPIPLESANRYQWAVYISEDNSVWTQHAALAFRSYDRFDGRFRLTFASVSARFLKVVNLTVDDSLGAVFVSELELSGLELRRGESRSTSASQNASGTVSWAPDERFSASLSGYGNRITSRRDAGPELESQDTSGQLAFSFIPFDGLSGSFSVLDSHRTRSLAPAEDERSYSLSLTAVPVRDLNLTVASTYRDQRRADERAESLAWTLRAAALLYRDLSVSADYGEAYEESLDGPARTRRTVRAGLDTRPREELSFNTSLLISRLEPVEPDPAVPTERTVYWSNLMTIRPSSVLYITLQGIYYKQRLEDGWSRVLQADWLPFAGGSLQLSVDYREDVPLFGAPRRIRSGRLRWNLNRSMLLDFEAARESARLPTGDTTSRSRLSALFEARF